MFEDMKVLILDNCEYLTHISDVSGLPNLEKFSFVRCHNLVTIHNSIRYLNKLKILNVEGCEKLESFPPLQSPSLQNLEFSNCKSLKSFPELLCKMTNIKSIWLEETSIEKFQSSFQNLSELSHLTISSSKLKINLLKILRLDECKCFEENRAITLNPEKLSGFQCKPGHKSKGHAISFWFRKKIPFRTIYYSSLFVNGYKYTLLDKALCSVGNSCLNSWKHLLFLKCTNGNQTCTRRKTTWRRMPYSPILMERENWMNISMLYNHDSTDR